MSPFRWRPYGGKLRVPYVMLLTLRPQAHLRGRRTPSSQDAGDPASPLEVPGAGPATLRPRARRLLAVQYFAQPQCVRPCHGSYATLESDWTSSSDNRVAGVSRDGIGSRWRQPLEIRSPCEPIVWIESLQMGRDLRPRLTLQSFTEGEMSPDELRTLRRERLRPFDQIEWLPGARGRPAPAGGQPRRGRLVLHVQ